MSLASVAARLAGREILGVPSDERASISRRVPWVGLACGTAVALALYHAYRMYWLCDDAYISFRYARQLTDGYGLVFNRGERVEGYTNFLWVLEVAVGMMLGASPEATSVALSVLATVLLFAVVARLSRTSPLAEGAIWPPVFALLLLAANRSVAVWTTSGLETRQFTLFSLLAIVSAGAGLRRFRATSEVPPPDGTTPLARLWSFRFELASSLCAALAEATRPEGGLVFACVGGAYVCLGPVRALSRRALRRDRGPGGDGGFRDAFAATCAMILPALALIGVHYVFRRAYYGDWLPNTYYAKHVRPWPESGDKYFVAAWIEHGAFLLIPLAIAGTAVRAARGDLVHVLAWSVLVPHALYVRQIGGDHFEFRPLDLHWPLLTAMAVDALLWVRNAAGRGAAHVSNGGPWPPAARFATAPPAASRARSARSRGPSRRGVLGAAAAWVLLLEYTTIVQRAFEHETRGRETRGTTYKLRGQVNAGSAPELRWVLPDRLVRMYNDASYYCVEHQSCTRQGEHRAYWKLLEKEFGPYRSMTREEIERALPNNLIWARDAVGYAPYVLPNVTVIDLFGLTDRTIARNPVVTPNDRRVMAHDRRPPPGYLSERGINIQLGAASRSQGEALRHGYWAVRVRPDLWIPFRTFDGDWVVEHFKNRHIFSQFWFDPGVASNNRGWVDGHYTHGVAFIGRFDDGLDGFSVVPAGAARVRASSAVPKELQALGAGFLTTEHESLGARSRGRASSPPFHARGILAFVMSGSGTPAPAVRLLRGGDVVREWRARGAQTLELETLDLAPYQGEPLSVEVMDDSTDGFVSVDQIMLVEPDARGA